MISMEMERKLILKTVKKVRAKTKFEFGNKIRLLFRKVKMTLYWRQNAVTTEMILQEMGTLKTSMEWILKEEIEKKMVVQYIIFRIRSVAVLKRTPWTLSILRRRM